MNNICLYVDAEKIRDYFYGEHGTGCPGYQDKDNPIKTGSAFAINCDHCAHYSPNQEAGK